MQDERMGYGWALPRYQPHRMSVRITDKHAATEAEARRWKRHCCRRDQRKHTEAQQIEYPLWRTGHQRGLPVRHIVRSEIERRRPSVSWRQILEQFDARPFRRTKRC